METIHLVREGAVAQILLARPERLNAINAKMIDELSSLLDELERDPEVRAVVLGGEGRAFCAGFDLKEGLAQKREGIEDWRRVYRRDLEVIMRLWDSPLPTVAGVQGYALGGGCELALACDITVAGEDAIFGEPELKFGSGVVALLLPWLTNPKKAKELLLTGNDRLGAQEALDCGLVNKVVPAGTHLEAALAVARTIATMDRDAVAMTKAAINHGFEIMGLRKALEVGAESGAQIEASETPERSEFNRIARSDGLKAAIAWREARFGARPPKT
jgi:enoyl-CoA hydratase